MIQTCNISTAAAAVRDCEQQVPAERQVYVVVTQLNMMHHVTAPHAHAAAKRMFTDLSMLPDFLTACCLLRAAAERQLGFHCIVLDPPWENKSAKRGSKYPTLPSRNLKGIALQKLMHAVSF